MKIVGLCLVVALLASAVAVASASATTLTFLLPGGKLQDFSSKAGPGVLVAKSGTSGENIVECKSATNTGSVLNHTDLIENVLIRFEKCTSKILTTTYTCSSGSEEGVIKTNELNGQLGLFTSATSNETRAGIVLKAEPNATTNPNTLFAEFTCTHSSESVPVKVRGKERGTSGEKGGIIAEVLPESVDRSIPAGDPGFLTYKTNASPHRYIQLPNTLVVLGTSVTELLLEANFKNETTWNLAGLEQEKDVEIFFLELAEIST
ncbi:MAG TPA: hypothetical protein VG147_15100 [Solirubrobacteraceae bacterium]|jgi:hypothetical protein|nr:hypothetical protein [Solirubrobacteraceae bacterium]